MFKVITSRRVIGKNLEHWKSEHFHFYERTGKSQKIPERATNPYSLLGAARIQRVPVLGVKNGS